MASDCWLPVVLYGEADQAVGEYGADPPQHHDRPNYFYSTPKWRGDEDAVEKHQDRGLSQETCGTLKGAGCVPKLWMSSLAQLARRWGRECSPFVIQQIVLGSGSKDAARDHSCGHLRMYVSKYAGFTGVLGEDLVYRHR